MTCMMCNRNPVGFFNKKFACLLDFCSEIEPDKNIQKTVCELYSTTPLVYANVGYFFLAFSAVSIGIFNE